MKKNEGNTRGSLFWLLRHTYILFWPIFTKVCTFDSTPLHFTVFVDEGLVDTWQTFVANNKGQGQISVCYLRDYLIMKML